MTSTSTGSAPEVVVVGSGIAGLAAGIEAAAAGAQVVILEREPTVGGASRMSGAGCCLVDTPLQRSLGIHDSPELALSDWLAIGGESVDVDWASRYVADSATEVYAWCEGLGVEWERVGQPEGNSVPRWHFPARWGAGIVEACLRRARDAGVTVRTGYDVRAVTPGSATERPMVQTDREDIPVDAVVVATGGFAGDLGLVLRHAPHLRRLPRVLSGSAPTSTGSGLSLLRGVEPRLVNLDHVWVYPTGTPDPRDPRGERGLGVRGIANGIWVNRDGRRFHNEDLSGGKSGTEALLAQPGCTSWLVFPQESASDLLLIDNEYYATPAGPHPRAIAEFLATSAFVTHAAGARELADHLRLPVQPFVDTVAAFMAALSSGSPAEPEFGRQVTGLRAWGDAALIAIQLFPMAQKNFGGVATDQDCAVLDSAGHAVPGVLAAGEVAGMAGGSINGVAALEGTMFGPALYSGRIAGRSAARRVRSSR